MLTILSRWEDKNAKIYELTKEELTCKVFDTGYREICYGMFEPTDLLLSLRTYEFLRDGLFKDIPEFMIYKKYHGALIEFSAPANEIIFTWEDEKLDDKRRLAKKIPEREGKPTVAIFKITDLEL